MAVNPVPLPPKPLMRRVGWDVYSRDPADGFDERGREQWRFIQSLLPSDRTLSGASVFDFGSAALGAFCGPRSKRLRRPATGVPTCTRPSIEWLRAHLPGPARVFQNGEWPPLPAPDREFDVIYAFSVFTHLVDSWSAWLLELHRVLKDDGLLIVTVFGPGHNTFSEEPISEETTGMNVLYPSASWDVGGPLIVHSEWWLRAHWGRAFEIVKLRGGEPAGPPPLFGQSALVLRKRPGRFTVEELERYEPDEPRELAALEQNVLSLRREIARHEIVLNSRSWRLTAPLRRVAVRLRASKP